MKGMMGGPLLVGGLGPGPPALPPLNSALIRYRDSTAVSSSKAALIYGNWSHLACRSELN